MRFRTLVLCLSAALPAAFPPACAAPNPERPQEAPEVQFEKALVVATVAPEQRAAIEDRVRDELLRRRPDAKIVSARDGFPDLAQVTPSQLRAYVQTHRFDVVITIVPFEAGETGDVPGSDGWSGVAGRELGLFLQGRPVHGLLGTYGVHVAAWDARTGEPLYTYTREPRDGESAGAGDVADFAVESMSGSKR